ncbi:hypothetical protein [Bradyrhizobium sp. Cp5.3]|uniref:hypothetical protein n=1 Tax=Bradyrhizobium sp. Cp5.3 TaxID=443598 RepID=UPI000402D85F|nr:hypothetical protein [Bradyrhizobium sp. Cp5.3]
MTPLLLLSRDCIIYWVNIWIAPVEYVFDLIESELERRGISPECADPVVLPATASS